MKRTLAALGLISVVACSSDFTPYEEIDRPRLLAIAADGSELVPGATTSLSALVSEADVSYRWSWCPLTGSAEEGHPCLVTEAELQAIIDEAVGPGMVTVPPYDLGAAPTAVLEHAIAPELWFGLCELILGDALPEGLDFPLCESGFDVAVLLDVVIDGESVTGKREVRLLYDDATPPNATPVATAATAIDPDSGERIPLDAVGTAVLRRDVTYDLELAIAQDQAESFEQVPIDGGPAQTVLEDLRASWFHDLGELDRSATSFLDGSTTFEDLTTNEWTTPAAADEAPTTGRLFFVLRDDRGGTSWVQVVVGFEQ